MMLIDTHTHLFLKEFDADRDEVLNRAVKKGVKKLILPNVDSSTTLPMLDLCSRFPDHCYPMMGLHPTSVRDNYKDELTNVENWLKKGIFVAVGEIGIDLYWEKKFLFQQLEAFAHQIILAKKFQLPIVIHSRESFDEIFDIMDDLNDENLKGIFHAFTGTHEQAERAIGYGFKLGIGGIVTFKNSGLDKVVSMIDPVHLVLETDSPYLAPTPKRGHRNEPSYLIYTANKIAGIHGTTVEEVARITTQNALTLFGLNDKI